MSAISPAGGAVWGNDGHLRKLQEETSNRKWVGLEVQSGPVSPQTLCSLIAASTVDRKLKELGWRDLDFEATPVGFESQSQCITE